MRAIAEIATAGPVNNGSNAGDFVSIIIMLLILGFFVFGAVNLIQLLRKSINKEDTTKYKKRLLGCVIAVLIVVVLMFVLRFVIAAIK